jgi:glycerate-2-kinase
MRVDIEVARSSDVEDLAQSLTAQGIKAEVLTEPDRIAATADDLALVEHAVESWTAERGLPFVPLHVDEQHVVLSPPGS